MRYLLLIILGLLSIWDTVSGATFPFTDVKESDAYYDGVRDLYEYGIISDDGTGLFRPSEAITRDMFVGLSISVSCQKCLSPSIEDILHYSMSPFIDLEKRNPYFYCIAWASEKNIVLGYTPDTSGKSTCQNGKSYSSNTFCAENRTSRIEAVAMLLRQAKLWDDTKNQSFTKTREIVDVSTYWYGYAEKWISAGILTLWSDKRVRPDESITRWEFAMMAGKILNFNQCSLLESGNRSWFWSENTWFWWTNENAIVGMIGARSASGSTISSSRFSVGDGTVLIPITSSGSWNYRWKATDPLTGDIISSMSPSLPIDLLSGGKWIIELDIIDRSTGEIVSHPTRSIFIDGENARNPQGGIELRADPISGRTDTPINFETIFSRGEKKDGATYSWDFGNGTSSSNPWDTSHTYKSPGIYEARVTLTNPDGTSYTDSIAINILDSSFTSNTVPKTDTLSVSLESAPLINSLDTPIDFRSYISGGSGNISYYWDYGDGSTSTKFGDGNHTYTSAWIYTVTLIATDALGNRARSDIIIEVTGSRDTDRDGVDDSIDRCLLIQWQIDNFGCPKIETGIYNTLLSWKLWNTPTGLSIIDTDRDGIGDERDACRYIPWVSEYDGCTGPSYFDTITRNICVEREFQSRWLIIATPVCNVCPCENTITLLESARKCDIFFPAILSPDRKNIYSRGKLYQIQ